jgi:arginyl-tRNA synthetase
MKTTGESGVYLQYAYTRATSLLRKIGPQIPSGPPPDLDEHDRALCLRMADYPRIALNAASLRSPNTLAKYGFDLASAFSTFYDNTPPVVSEPDARIAAWRGGLVAAFRLVLGDILDTLGIPRLERM